MDYEKAYKEALERARKLYKDAITLQLEQDIKDYEQIFPELKESEDERIRKRLIDLIYKVYAFTNYITCVEYENIIAWLEKQGDTTSDIRYDGVNAGASLSVVNGKPFDYEHATITQKDFASVGKTATIELSSPIDCGDRIYHVSHKPIEKQGEQKPAVVDFNAKDWYVSKVDGKIHDMTYNPTDKVEPKFKVKYAGSEYNVLEVKDIAGVTFYGIEDEPNHIDYVKAENCKIISGYAIKENGSAYPTKPAEWSEEDEFILEDAITAVDLMLTPKFQESNPNLYKSFEVAKHWLKSLKDRVQPKQEWSEEDERMCQETIDWFEKKCFPYALEYENPARESIHWLKSLKGRVQPKPKEWNDEDDYNLQCMIAKVTYDIQKGNVGRNNELIDWLKSLKDKIKEK